MWAATVRTLISGSLSLLSLSPPKSFSLANPPSFFWCVSLPQNYDFLSQRREVVQQSLLFARWCNKKRHIEQTRQAASTGPLVTTVWLVGRKVRRDSRCQTAERFLVPSPFDKEPLSAASVFSLLWGKKHLAPLLSNLSAIISSRDHNSLCHHVFYQSMSTFIHLVLLKCHRQ